MRKITIVVFTATLFLVHNTVNAQIDQERMEKDLEVAENILSTLLGNNREHRLWGAKVESSYLEGFGVIFSLPREYSFTWASPVIIDKDRSEGGNVVVMPKSDAKEVDGGFEAVRESLYDFLADYSDLIGQLKPEERIVIQSLANTAGRYYAVIVGETRSGIRGGFKIQVQRKFVSDYKQGKITRERFDQAVEQVKMEDGEGYKDLELFGSILRRLYSSDLSRSYFTDRVPSYEVLEGYGVIFHMKTYSSYAEDKDRFLMPVLGRNDVELAERNETVVTLYPRFEDDLKSNLIEYGRTVKTISEKEKLVIRVGLTKCDGCDIPESIELSVDAGVLSRYDRREISLDQAKREVSIKKTARK